MANEDYKVTGGIMSKVREKLGNYFNAGFPIILYKAVDENKAVAMIQEIVGDRRLIQWRVSEYKDPFEPDAVGPRNLDDALYLLHSNGELQVNHSVLLIRDGEKYIENPDVIGYLKRFSEQIAEGETEEFSIVLLGQHMTVPSELERYVTIIEDEPMSFKEIEDYIDNFCSDYDLTIDKALRNQLANAFKGLSEFDMYNILALAYANDGELNYADIDLILEQKKQVVQRTSILEMVPLKESIEDIGGLESLKKWIRVKEQVFNHVEEALAFGVDMPKGVLIAGVPGCGKSLAAKATAHLFKAPLLRLDMGRIMGKYVGESEKNMRKALKLCEDVAPCVLWIDEIEKGFAGIGGDGGNAEITSRLLGSFLTWLQEKKSQVFVVMTANKIDKLPPELIRKGRLDDIFFVGLPSKTEREKIFDIHIKARRPQDLPNIQIHQLVNKTEGYSGADIEGVIKEAVEIAFTNGKSAITTDDIVKVIQTTHPLKEIMKEQIEAMEKVYKEKKFKSAS